MPLTVHIVFALPLLSRTVTWVQLLPVPVGVTDGIRNGIQSMFSCPRKSHNVGGMLWVLVV